MIRTRRDDAVATLCFGAIERLISILEKQLCVAARMSSLTRHDTDADRDITVSPMGTLYLVANSLRYRCRSLGCGGRQHDHEFLAAVTGHGVGFSCRAANDLREKPQRAVSRKVTVRVVERLEVIDIAEQQRERLIRALRPRHGLIELLCQGQTIVEAGERIGDGLGVQLHVQPAPAALVFLELGLIGAWRLERLLQRRALARLELSGLVVEDAERAERVAASVTNGTPT